MEYKSRSTTKRVIAVSLFIIGMGLSALLVMDGASLRQTVASVLEDSESQESIQPPSPPPAESAQSQQSQQSQQVDLSPPPDILSCKLANPLLIISQGQKSFMRCKLQPAALVTAWIIKGAYAPPADPAPDSLIKNFLYHKTLYDQFFALNWDGIDAYDTPVDDGDYTFYVSARKTPNGKPDISIQKFKVMQAAPPNLENTQESTQEAGTQTATGGESQQLQPAADEQTQQGETEQTQETQQPPLPPEPSKCPAVNYPNDIENHWAKDAIRQAYDDCILKGYKDGSFHPDEALTRAEAVKIGLLAAGLKPKLGCYTVNCGTAFEDLEPWQSQWIRSARDHNIVEGVTKNSFQPNRPITRAEASVLVAKAFGIKPYQGCFTPNCGAGQPDNFFLDIIDSWAGPYLRALWDQHIISGIAPYQFGPDRPMTRAEMAQLIANAKAVLNQNSPAE